MFEKLKSKRILYLIVAVNVILLAVNGVFLVKNFDNKDTATSTSNELPYLSKRIFLENQNDILLNFIPLREAMREYINQQNNTVGAYFEYLPSGTSIGVNEHLEVKLASLVKIPLVMAVYKMIEDGSIKKDEVLTLKAENLDKAFGDIWKIGVGGKITTWEAINLTLTKSDNTAANVLTSRVGANAVAKVFDSLDVSRDKEVNGALIISPKSYSSILRSLYLSSYLHEQSSNEVLDILTKTIFNDKLPAGIPPSVKIAHKIGVFEPEDSPDKTYSDCGIVYVPNRPYLLCIMSNSNEEKSRAHMQELSKMAYEYISSVNTR